MRKQSEIIAEIREYFEQRADAEYYTDRAGPVPNEEMQMLAKLDELQAAQAPASGDVEPVAEVITSEFERLDSCNPDRVKDIDWLDHIDADQFPDGTKLYTHPPAKVPEEVIKQCEQAIDEAAQRKGGTWSGVREAQKKIRELLTTPTPATTPETEWVQCEDKLPTEAEAGDLERVWVCSPIGAVWLAKIYDMQFGIYPLLEGGWYWKPTGLKRPEPPKEQ